MWAKGPREWEVPCAGEAHRLSLPEFLSSGENKCWFDLVRFEKSSWCNDTCISAFKRNIPFPRLSHPTSEGPLFRKAFPFPRCSLEKPKQRTGSWEALGWAWEDSEGLPEIREVQGREVPFGALGPEGVQQEAPCSQSSLVRPPRELFRQVGSVPSEAF